MAWAYKSATYELMRVGNLAHGSHEPMSRKSKVGTESGGTWHHPYVIESLLDNRKQHRGCNRVNLVEALRSILVKRIELG